VGKSSGCAPSESMERNYTSKLRSSFWPLAALRTLTYFFSIQDSADLITNGSVIGQYFQEHFHVLAGKARVANPTFTIVALSIRLAEHLTSTLHSLAEPKTAGD
jgi:hypothetical protein